MQKHPTNKKIVFKDINLTGAFLALSALKSGHEVEILLPYPPCLDYLLVTTHFYPLSSSEILNSNEIKKSFNTRFSLFPWLIKAQRVVLFTPNTIPGPKKIYLTDKLLHLDREEATFPISFEKKDFSLQNPFDNPKGLSIREFQTDYHMAIIETLLKCKELGGLIQIGHNTEQHLYGSVVIICNSKPSKLLLEKTKPNLSPPTHYLIKTADFELIISIERMGVFLQFITINCPDKDHFCGFIKNLFPKMGIQYNQNIENRLGFTFSSFTNSVRLNEKGEIILPELSLSEISKNLKKTTAVLRTQHNLKIKTDLIPKGIIINHLSEEEMRRRRFECEEKYDLVKQTGIDYSRFSDIFHRYYNQIDDMIECAYSGINPDNTNLAWVKAEERMNERILNTLLQ
jgi:hypothetical protein